MSDIAAIITAIGLLLTAITGAASAYLSWRNGRTLKEVHRTTNSLSERNEAISKKLGIAEGKAAGLQQGRDESNASK